MDTSAHNLPALFVQLGLPGHAHAIDEFIGRHRVPAGGAWLDLPVWTARQQQFLQQALAEDADWALAVDELAARLSEPLLVMVGGRSAASRS